MGKRQKKSAQLAEKAFDCLKSAQLALLDGNVSYQELIKLKNTMENSHLPTSVKKLSEIRDEIKLRLEIEIAKRE